MDQPTQRPETQAESQPQPRTLRMPHIYVILLILITLAALATHLIPAGLYDRVAGPMGREVVDPDSFHVVDSTPVGIVEYLTAIPRGFIDAAEIIIFMFAIGGAFMVLRETGIIDLAVSRLARRFARRGILVIPLLMTVFALIATFIGTQELVLVYIPVLLPLLLALRFDALTAAALALVATTAGFTAALTNPVTVGLGQSIAGIPIYSGVFFRAVVFAVLVTTGILYVMYYAHRVRRRPESTPVPAKGGNAGNTGSDTIPVDAVPTDAALPVATRRQRVAIVVTLGFLAVLLYGVLGLGWFMTELGGLFIAMGAVVGLIAGLSTTQVCDAFTEGMRTVLLGTVIVGVARGVAVMLEDGQVLDTVVHGLAVLTTNLPGLLAPIGMFLAQAVFNFLVPSGSGQAVITMPIMAPLADILDVTRQTAVLAFQFGDGMFNIIYPTSGYFMAALALAGVSWFRWLRFIWPLMVLWSGVAIATLLVAQTIGWGP